MVLPGLFGSREFLDAYAAALGEQPAKPQEHAPTMPGSFRALATRYFGSPQFLSLAPTSQTNYRRAIDRFLVEHGHRPVDQMKREHVDAILGKFADKPGAGIILLKRDADAAALCDGDRMARERPECRRARLQSREIHTWDENEIATFEARWPIGSANSPTALATRHLFLTYYARRAACQQRRKQ